MVFLKWHPPPTLRQGRTCDRAQAPDLRMLRGHFLRFRTGQTMESPGFDLVPAQSDPTVMEFAMRRADSEYLIGTGSRLDASTTLQAHGAAPRLAARDATFGFSTRGHCEGTRWR